MRPSAEFSHLNGHHRDTLVRIFEHPTSHNIEWHDVLSLLGAVGSVEERHDGKYLIRIGAESEIVTRPKHADVDTQMIVNFRRMLTAAGYLSVVTELQSKGKEI